MEFEIAEWGIGDSKKIQKFCCQGKQKNEAVAGSCINSHYFCLFVLSWKKQSYVCILMETAQERGNNDAEERGQN